MTDRVDGMLQAVKAAGLKLTPQRVAIIRELADDPSHPTAQDLYERLRANMPTMSFATVYNTLAALSEQGLCAVRALGRGAVRFDPNVLAHDHAVCDSCGVVLDVAIAGDEVPASLEGFAVREVERVYRGVCAACSAR